MAIMTRTAFLESLGATRRNTRWSWSAVNHDKRFVIFGAWDEYASEHGSLILSEDWVLNRPKTKRNPGYPESREHIRLVEEEGYQLKTFAMQMRNERAHLRGEEPAKIESFAPKAVDKKLAKHGPDWFAV